jgi:hypothetical protein
MERLKPVTIVTSGREVLEAARLLQILIALCRSSPQTVYTVLHLVRDGKRINCPFPGDCAQFPCESLSCYGDVCDNGHVYRQS